MEVIVSAQVADLATAIILETSWLNKYSYKSNFEEQPLELVLTEWTLSDRLLSRIIERQVLVLDQE